MELGVGAHAYNLSTQETEAGGVLGFEASLSYSAEFQTNESGT